MERLLIQHYNHDFPFPLNATVMASQRCHKRTTTSKTVPHSARPMDGLHRSPHEEHKYPNAKQPKCCNATSTKPQEQAEEESCVPWRIHKLYERQEALTWQSGHAIVVHCLLLFQTEVAKAVRDLDLIRDTLPVEVALRVLWCIKSDFRINLKDKPQDEQFS